MTIEEFEEWFAQDTGMSTVETRKVGISFEPCDCGLGDCPGWKPVVKEARDADTGSQ